MSKHEYDKNYTAIPDQPESSMIDMSKLPQEIQLALHVLREYEAQGAVWPALITDECRAWFRYQERLNRKLVEVAKDGCRGCAMCEGGA